MKLSARGHTLSPEKYDAELPRLREKLLDAHLELRARKFSVLVIISGADGAGKGELVQRLNEWLDPRGVATHAFWEPTDEERERPAYWRFWRAMPGRGRVGIFFGSWYSAPIVRRVLGKTNKRAFTTEMEHIVAFENMLAADGTLIVKLWLHLSKKAQKKRLKKLERDGRIAPDDWKHFKLYDRFTKISERALNATDTTAAPWHLIDATDRRYRELTVGKILLKALSEKLRAPVRAAPAPRRPALPARSSLNRIDLKQQLTHAAYARELADLQTRLGQLAWAAHEQKTSMVLMFEGWDAAGKGSAIRRVTQAMDPRLYRVVGIAAPTDEERAQHYLWRFWRHLPRAGFTTIFDRSWYGRVLVERIEGFAKPAEWGRAYAEINDFEAQLAAHGIVLCKFWLHISPPEQLRRFKERQHVAYKQYKITDEDWRNREKWPDYRRAVDEMVARCSPETAPWTIVAGDDKKFARVQILKTVAARLEAVL